MSTAGTEVIGVVAFILGVCGSLATKKVYNSRRAQDLIALQESTIVALEADIAQRDRQIHDLEQRFTLATTQVEGMQRELDRLGQLVTQKANVDQLRGEFDDAINGPSGVMAKLDRILGRR
jgi:hypothetical protein